MHPWVFRLSEKIRRLHRCCAAREQQDRWKERVRPSQYTVVLDVARSGTLSWVPLPNYWMWVRGTDIRPSNFLSPWATKELDSSKIRTIHEPIAKHTHKFLFAPQIEIRYLKKHFSVRDSLRERIPMLCLVVWVQVRSLWVRCFVPSSDIRSVRSGRFAHRTNDTKYDVDTAAYNLPPWLMPVGTAWVFVLFYDALH